MLCSVGRRHSDRTAQHNSLGWHHRCCQHHRIRRQEQIFGWAHLDSCCDHGSDLPRAVGAASILAELLHSSHLIQLLKSPLAYLTLQPGKIMQVNTGVIGTA